MEGICVPLWVRTLFPWSEGHQFKPHSWDVTVELCSVLVLHGPLSVPALSSSLVCCLGPMPLLNTQMYSFPLLPTYRFDSSFCANQHFAAWPAPEERGVIETVECWRGSSVWNLWGLGGSLAVGGRPTFRGHVQQPPQELLFRRKECSEKPVPALNGMSITHGNLRRRSPPLCSEDLLPDFMSPFQRTSVTWTKLLVCSARGSLIL